MAGTSSDWVEILEPRSCERMYVNLTTGECGWDPPAGVPVRQADGNQWWELFDSQSGRFYYYNSTGRRTVWHRPQGADIVPLSQLQAMKRCSEAKRTGGSMDRHHHRTTGSISSVGSQGGCTPLPEPEGDGPFLKTLETNEEKGSAEVDPAVDSRSQGDGSSNEHSTDGSTDTQRNSSQRWQPTPGSKAAMLVKVNSMSRSQPSPALQQPNLQHSVQGKANTFSNKAQGGQLGSAQGYKTAPSGKMTADTRQAHHLRKVSNGSFCLVTESSHPSPLLHRSQTSTPRPISPQYGSSAPIYDEPVRDCPIYDEPPIDMEVEGAHLYNGEPLSRMTPTHSLQKPRQLQHPGSSHSGSRHRRNPSSDYSPAGLECIKHMVNVDPKQGLVSSSPLPTRSPSPTSRQDPVVTQPHPQPQAPSLPQARGHLRDREPGTPGPSTLDKKQNWRVLEATVQRAMEARHSRQSSQASQDFLSSTPQATANYQDSGYSTGPSPSLRRKSRRRVGAGGAGGRPGSVGSSGELCALNERLMAEMREVVSRSNTMREVRAGLDPEMAERGIIPRTRSPADSLRWYGGVGSAGRCASREDLAVGPQSQGNPALTLLEIPGRQKRTYEKVDTLEMSVNSQASLSSPDTPGPPSQTGTLELQAQLENRKKGMVDGRTASLGPYRPANNDSRDGGDGAVGRAGGSSFPLSYSTLRQPPPPDMGMEDWASKHLNMHTQGLFRRRVSIANMLSWNRGSIKKPMLVTSDRAVRKEACEMFKLVQAYMGDRPSRLDRRHCALLIVTKCWDMPGLRDELYVQLVRQTTGNASPRSLAAGWELMAVSLAFFAPSPKFRCYLDGYIQRHTEPTCDKKLTEFILEQQELKLKKNSKSRKKRKQNSDEEEGLPISTYSKFCHRKLQKVAITGGKKGLRKPTLEEIDHSRRAIITPSLFGSSLEEVMERQSELFPDRKLPWVQVQLSQYVLALGGAQAEGIFRVPGDIDEVNALKLQVDQWRIPENLSDPNVPASLMKLWYRELEEPLIPMNFYKQCISNCDDPAAAIAVVQSLPELSRLVLCYFIHFLQVFAQPSNVAVTKMDVNNLAMVMAPNCLRCQSEDPRVIFENTRKEMSFLRMLIVHLDTSFIEGVV
ncbi:rho GTPase-activating 39-like isoform X2 [Solea senegalensis]|uniref:Rho GTPase-activating protein 39 n=2 Tax=Solea senegalensis TaxID=28829 RepID=A0AAV6QPD9_SOLSE|nr:rho GTPase-activating protein 39 isoform X2 [Solea senegalensis]KAG7494885.1 rho GTPase-activating 39-like isoform X2 [Solea senegalensis]